MGQIHSEVNGETVFYTKHAQEATACSYDFLIKESRWSTVQVVSVKKKIRGIYKTILDINI